MTAPYIVFDRGKLENLKASFEASIAYTLRELPTINWNSPAQIKDFFEKHFQITLENTTIKTFAGQRLAYEHDPELFDLFTGIIQYLKLKATLNNYILNILKHLDGDRYHMRADQGHWRMQNHQPLFHSEELWACVKSYSADLLPLIEALNDAS